MLTLIVSVVFSLCVETIGYAIPDDYHRVRHDLISQESQQYVGGRIKLTPDETIVNNLLMEWKNKETEKYLLAKHYFTYKKYLKNSKIYQFLKQMPKGAALHLHSSFLLDSDALLNLTYEDHLYACFEEFNLKFTFSEDTPNKPCDGTWGLLKDMRNQTKNVAELDQRIKKHLTMYTEDEHLQDLDSKAAWERFDKLHRVISPLLAYRPVYEKYLKTCLKTFYEDNIMYMEVRGGLKKLYELNGTIHDKRYYVQLVKQIVDKFKKDYPNFIGLKIIFAIQRKSDSEYIDESINWLRENKDLQDIVIGFDLVGQEDEGKPLVDFLPVLKSSIDHTRFYFHAGETNWIGRPVDENLIDAVLLGAKRIGHAFALVKHPAIIDIVRQKGIALEINVISNVVLSYVDDMRNHPLANYLALGLPVVLSSDDPGAWDSTPLTDDFYVTFVGVASEKADLKLLKQLAINSITYSALSVKEKVKAFRVFYKEWNEFISNFIQSKGFAHSR